MTALPGIDEARWSPIKTLLWIVTRSHKFMKALERVPVMFLEECYRMQRENHSPYLMTFSNALQIFRQEAERGNIRPVEREFPRETDGALCVFNEHEFWLMPMSFRAYDVLQIWPDWPSAQVWKAASARDWKPPGGLSKGAIRRLPPEPYLPFGDVVDFLAFGPAKLSIGLADLEEQTARLIAGIALVGTASEGRLALVGTPCERHDPQAHILLHRGPRMAIGPDMLKDLAPVPYGARDWLGPRRYAENYAETGHAPQSVSFCGVMIERDSLLKWLRVVSTKIPGLSEEEVTSLIRGERVKNPEASIGQMEQLVKSRDPLFPRERVRQIARAMGIEGRRGRPGKNSAEECRQKALRRI